MPIEIPNLDDRRYDELVREALARIPIHNPEWTNFQDSDPGVTLIQLFAFMTESLLYRANRIPERNRLKFLSLLGIGLNPGSAASGIVSFANDRGPLEAALLPKDLEVRAGSIPFRTDDGIDLLPVEPRPFYKRLRPASSDEVTTYYERLYEAYDNTATALPTLTPYETVSLVATRDGIDLGSTTDGAFDRSIWIALLAREGADPDDVREAIANRSLAVGIVPAIDDDQRTLRPIGTELPTDQPTVEARIPHVTAPDALLDRHDAASWRQLPVTVAGDLARGPSVLYIALPGSAQMIRTWTAVHPLAAGVGVVPPILPDPDLEPRVVTWVRLTWPQASSMRLRWVGVNAARVSQRLRVGNEFVGTGDGSPSQSFRLATTPIVPGSGTITLAGPDVVTWGPIDDLAAARPEGATDGTDRVYRLDNESGTLTFGDGHRGRRPHRGAVIRASYDASQGAEGNLPANAISSGPTLPAGVSVTNPVETFGGLGPETAVDGERRITSTMRHRSRLVSVEDFEEITKATPGISVGRVDVLTAFAPELSQQSLPGDAPGAVTLMVVPDDRERPNGPEPSAAFLDAICRHIEPRRLITTEVHLRGPEYVDLAVSVALQEVAGFSPPEVVESVKAALVDWLSPLERNGMPPWPRRRAIRNNEIETIASRVDGVRSIEDVRMRALSRDATQDVEEVTIEGLELPRLSVVSVIVGGTATSVDALLGETLAVENQGRALPIPAIPEDCA